MCLSSLFMECLRAQLTVLALILLLPSLRCDLCNPVSTFSEVKSFAFGVLVSANNVGNLWSECQCLECGF